MRSPVPPPPALQVVDRAMSLLLELSQARRSALRSAEDARGAVEAAYLQVGERRRRGGGPLGWFEVQVLQAVVV